MIGDPYNAEVRRRFIAPGHAGSAEGPSERGAGQGVDIELSAGVSDGRLAECRFRAFGCPHTIAACDLACEQWQGQPVQDLPEPDISGLMQSLSVPVEKTGRILVLEDVLRALKSRLDSP